MSEPAPRDPKAVRRIPPVPAIRSFAVAAAILVVVATPNPSHAQEPAARTDSGETSAATAAPPGAAWNDARTVGLVRAAIDARMHPWGDSALAGFDLYAEGRVHYVADFGGGAGQQAVRADQVALQLRWRRGLGSLQELVGRRETEWLPTDIRYHVDHLTLVVDNYPDRIRVGEGDEIRDVPHPLGPNALATYDYRLVDSLRMEIAGSWKRLYRIEVRPKDPDRPAAVGTIDVEEGSRGLARLAVGFTPSSYIDPRLVDVSVELVNGLVHARYWLPASQRIEIRRRLKWMELPFGSSIRVSFKVLEYDLDPKGRGGVRTGHFVRVRPGAELEKYAGWRMPDLAAWPEDVRTDSVRLDEVRSEAAAIVKTRYLGGDGPLRLYLPSVSSAFRVRRAEGVYAGAGLRWEIDGRHALTATGGWAFGRGAGELGATLERRVGVGILSIGGHLNEPADVGPWPASSGLIATLDAAFRGDDWLDPYLRSGGSLSYRTPVGALGLGRAAVVWERQESATLELDPLGGTDARPVRSVADRTDFRLELELERDLGTWLGSRATGALGLELSDGDEFGYTRLVGTVVALPREPDATWAWEGSLGAGAALGTIPEQRLLLLGGRGTVPGYDFRPYAGDVAVFVNLAASRTVWHPWVRARLLAAAGWTGLGDAGSEAAARFGATDTKNVRTSLGAGLSLFYDLVRLEAARGLSGGRWEWIVSISPAFRPPL